MYRADATIADSRLVPRERLFARLDEALALGSVWLSGGAGTGKSSLVGSYLDARDLAHLHCRLDADDGDPFHLIARLNAAAVPLRPASTVSASISPTAAMASRSLADAAVPDPLVAGRQAFGRLFDALAAPQVIVFDDLDRLPAGCTVERLLVDGLAALPVGWSMILIGREEATASFARARATAILTAIGESDLRLTADESAALITRHARRMLSPDELERIVVLSDGWAALGVLLANTDAVPALAAPSDAEVPEVVFDFLAEEVLGTLEPALQRELELLALAPSLSGPLARRVCADDTPARLERLAARHFFVERLPASGVGMRAVSSTYRLHGLLRAFLVRRLSRRIGQSALRTAAVRVAGLLDEFGEAEAALALLLEYRAFDAAVPAMERLAPSMIRAQRHLTVLGWMRSLPPERVRESGTLSLWGGAASHLVDPLSARDHLERAWAACRSRPSSEAVLACCIAIDSWLVRWDDFHGMDVWIERLGTQLAARGMPADPDLAAHVACAMLNGSLFRGSDPGALADWHAHGLELLDHRASSPVYVKLAQALVLVPLWTRSLALAELVLERVRATVFAEEPVEPLVELWYRTLEAPMRWAQVDRAATEHACARGLACARKSGAGFSDVLLPYHAAIACLNDGDGVAASVYVEQVTDAIGTRTDRLMDLTCHHQIVGLLARHRGQTALAAEHLVRAAERASSAGLGFAAAFQHVGLAYLAADQGDETLARHWLAATRDDIGSLRLSMIELDIEMCEAWLARKRDESSLDELHRAFATARRDARLASCWWTRPMLAELCAVALEANIEVAHVTRIVRAHALSAPQRYRHLASWPWQIRLHLTGRVRTLVDDEQLAADGARGARPLELVHALASLGGRARASVLADLLWPDAEGDAAMDAFKTTLSRARRRLGIGGALPLVDGQLSLAPSVVWCDVVELTTLDRRAASAYVDTQQRRYADEAIIALYGGELLPDETRRWASDARRRLRDRWLRAVMRRGDALADAGRHAAAATVFEGALELAPGTEPLYRWAMAAHLLAGTPEAGLLLFERCCLELPDAPVRVPDAATESIHEALTVAACAI